MTALTSIVFIFGVLFALRYKVFVLVPAGLFALSIVLVIGTVVDATSWQIILGMILATITLNVGYLTGTAIRFALVTDKNWMLRFLAPSRSAN